MNSTGSHGWIGKTRLQSKAVSRRRLIGGGAAVAFGAAGLALVGCGGGDDDAGAGAGSGLVDKPIDNSKQAVRGGTLPISRAQDAAGFDALASNSTAVQSISAFSYSRLVKFKVGTLAQPTDGSLEGDAAASWEISTDGLQITFRIRPQVKLDPRPPTSGRSLKASDIAFSFEKYSRLGRTRSDLYNSINSAAPILSWQAPDDSTFVLKLAYPYPPILPVLANTQNIVIQPAEADGGFDPRAEMRGSGAWMLDRYVPSSGFFFKRNPGYYQSDRPFVDGLDVPIVTEYATGVSQFAAGHLATYGVRQTDILSLKRQQPSLRLLQNPDFAVDVPDALHFSTRPGVPYADDASARRSRC